MIAQVAFAQVRSCLIVTLLGELDVRGISELRDALLARIAAQRTRGVILDVSTVTVLDADDVVALTHTLTMCRVLGARALVVGLSPAVVHALVLLDAPLDGLDAEASVESALALLNCGGVNAA